MSQEAPDGKEQEVKNDSATDEKEEKKEIETKNKNNKYYNIDKENENVKQLIEIALLDIDAKTGQEKLNGQKKWIVYNTNDANISVFYRKLDENSNVYTIRGCTDINININDIYEFFDCSSTDEHEFNLEIDELNTSYTVGAVYDENHSLVHTAYDTGFPTWLIWPRDFCFIKRRIKFDNYIDPNDKNQSYRIAGSYCYSVDENHPDYVATKKNYVRGLIHFFGYIFIYKSENVCTMYYVCSLDPCGSIPTKVVNYSAPAQGMNVKGYSDNVDKIKKRLQNRRKHKDNK